MRCGFIGCPCAHSRAQRSAAQCVQRQDPRRPAGRTHPHAGRGRAQRQRQHSAATGGRPFTHLTIVEVSNVGVIVVRHSLLLRRHGEPQQQQAAQPSAGGRRSKAELTQSFFDVGAAPTLDLRCDRCAPW